MTDIQRKLIDLQAEAETLADLDRLTKVDMDRIVDIKRDQERLAESLTDAERAELSEAWFAYSNADGTEN